LNPFKRGFDVLFRKPDFAQAIQADYGNSVYGKSLKEGNFWHEFWTQLAYPSGSDSGNRRRMRASVSTFLTIIEQEDPQLYEVLSRRFEELVQESLHFVDVTTPLVIKAVFPNADPTPLTANLKRRQEPAAPVINADVDPET